MIERLKILQSKTFASYAELRDALKNDRELRNEVMELSRYFLKRSVSGCSNCFFDAYMELFNIKNMEDKIRFQIKRGAVLYDPVNKDVNKILSALNCTEELALYHLKNNPDSREYFSVLPDNVDELIAGMDKPKEPEAPKAVKPKEPKAPVTEKTSVDATAQTIKEMKN